jgi:hypothetical protein
VWAEARAGRSRPSYLSSGGDPTTGKMEEPRLSRCVRARGHPMAHTLLGEDWTTGKLWHSFITLLLRCSCFAFVLCFVTPCHERCKACVQDTCSCSNLDISANFCSGCWIPEYHKPFMTRFRGRWNLNTRIQPTLLRQIAAFVVVFLRLAQYARDNPLYGSNARCFSLSLAFFHAPYCSPWVDDPSYLPVLHALYCIHPRDYGVSQDVGARARTSQPTGLLALVSLAARRIARALRALASCFSLHSGSSARGLARLARARVTLIFRWTNHRNNWYWRRTF